MSLMDTIQMEMDRGINGSIASLYEPLRAWKGEAFDYEYISVIFQCTWSSQL